MRSPKHESGEGAERRHEEILAAATRCFARRGYHETRTLDLAREAGVSEGTLYNYFKDKEDLFLQAVEAISSNIEAARDEGMADVPSARDRLLLSAANIERHFEQHRDHAVILVRELMDRDVSADCKKFADGHLRSLGGHLAELARELGTSLTPSQTHALALSYMGAIHIMLTLWCVSGFKGSMDPGPVRYAKSFISILEGWGKAGEGS